jgi:hypothetical protein
MQIDDLEDEPKRPKAKWYKRVSWWQKAWPVLATCCLLVTAALLRKFGPHQASYRCLSCFFLPLPEVLSDNPATASDTCM